MKKHNFAAGEDLNEKANFVLTNPPYNLRRSQSDTHAVHCLFGSESMKKLAKVLGDPTKLGAHGQVSCTAVQFALY